MKKLEVFDNENNIPIVGKYYNICCAILERGEERVYIPVIGMEHSDPQIGATYKHYHVDGRFSNIWTDKNGITNQIVDTENKYSSCDYKGIEVRRKKCIRATTGIDPPKYLHNSNVVSRYMTWYNSMIGKSCAGKKCPHLGTTMIEQNGRLVCHLHKLQGSTTTFKIIEYAKTK